MGRNAANDDGFDFSAEDLAMADLDLAAPPLEPPPGLWARIAHSLDAPRVSIQRFTEGRWRRLAPGVRAKQIWDANTLLLDCRPGASIPDHEHKVEEHVIVLRGDLISAGDVFLEGDYHVTPAGGSHPVWTTKTGCLVLVRGAA